MEKKNTIQFNGKKITEARELHGMDIKKLIGLTGISRVSISNYENGKQIPNPENMMHLSRALRVKWDFFTLPTADPDRITYFRSLAAATKLHRSVATRKLDMMEHIVSAVGEFLPLPPVDLPDFNVPNPEKLSNSDIDRFADECRKFWGLGNSPISNLTALLELSGVIIFCSKSESDMLDAYSRWDKDGVRPFVHLCSNKGSAARSRFDLAHELAHILLHTKAEKSDVNYRTHFHLFEQQANRFAGAFLLPEESFASDIPKISLDFFAAIKPKWKTSVAAMIKRSAQIGFINEEEEKLFWIYYSRRGWRKNEPFDDMIEIEEPQLIKEVITSLIDSSLISREDILSRIPYENDLVAEFLHLQDVIGNPKIQDFSARLKKTLSNAIEEGKRHANVIQMKVA